ncbi:hypothetical protein BPODLACK_01707 [Gordonia sp. YY1]|nr:hypothetical protein BPODLACK_01707 [Gordonia sp. YY1]
MLVPAMLTATMLFSPGGAVTPGAGQPDIAKLAIRKLSAVRKTLVVGGEFGCRDCVVVPVCRSGLDAYRSATGADRQA